MYTCINKSFFMNKQVIFLQSDKHTSGCLGFLIIYLFLLGHSERQTSSGGLCGVSHGLLLGVWPDNNDCLCRRSRAGNIRFFRT